MDNDTKTCPFCGEEILSVAKKCKYCGEWLSTEKKHSNQNITWYIVLICIAIIAFSPVSLPVACLIGFVAGIVGNVIQKTIVEKK